MKMTEKEESSVAPTTNNSNEKPIDSVKNDTTDNDAMSTQKSRHWSIIVYPTEEFIKNNYPSCEYTGGDGWGTAPDDWREQLNNLGIPWAESPLHWKDRNPDGTLKKPHWHIILSWENGTTTYKNVLNICQMLNSPIPKKLVNPKGMYRYFNHLDNPEKYRYTDKPLHHNGFELQLTSTEITKIIQEITYKIINEDIREYAELLISCNDNPQYFDVATHHTLVFGKFIDSYRHNPTRLLKRILKNNTYDKEIQNKAKQRLNNIEMSSEIIDYENEIIDYETGEIIERGNTNESNN